jgi:diaminopimelate decarboxylase
MSRYDHLAARFGTPAYVYDLDLVVEARDQLFAQLPPGFDVFYALKANPHLDLARALREGPGRACRAEISSVGELDVATAAGFDPGEILYTGPGKTDGELDVAIGRGVRMFSVESLTDHQHVGAVAQRHGVVAKCLLRINSITGSASTSIRMMGRPSQFGIDSETLPQLLPALREVRGASVVGAHFFSQSNAKDEAGLVGEFDHVIGLAAQLEQDLGLPLEFLDIGGGFSSPYAVPGQRAGYDKLADELTRSLDLHLPRWRSGSPHLAVESGRYLVGSSGVLLCRVVNIKDSRGNRFVILDAGINAVGGLSGIGRLLPAAVGLDETGDDVASLVGPLCTPGDNLGRGLKVPELRIGDVVTVPNVGAYGVTASLLSFLGRPAPVEVVVRGADVVSVSRLEYQRAYAPSEVAGA